MTVTTVTKRAGHAVPYDRAKIRNAIAAASKEYVHPMTAEEIDNVTTGVEAAFGERTEISVEEIQDLVEKQLLVHGFHDIARRYITYRQRHAQRRLAQKHLMASYLLRGFRRLRPQARQCEHQHGRIHGHYAEARRGGRKALRRQLRS